MERIEKELRGGPRAPRRRGGRPVTPDNPPRARPSAVRRARPRAPRPGRAPSAEREGGAGGVPHDTPTSPSSLHLQPACSEHRSVRDTPYYVSPHTPLAKVETRALDWRRVETAQTGVATRRRRRHVPQHRVRKQLTLRTGQICEKRERLFSGLSVKHTLTDRAY